MLLQKRANTSGVGISNIIWKSIYLLTTIANFRPCVIGCRSVPFRSVPFREIGMTLYDTTSRACVVLRRYADCSVFAQLHIVDWVDGKS